VHGSRADAVRPPLLAPSRGQRPRPELEGETARGHAAPRVGADAVAARVVAADGAAPFTVDLLAQTISGPGGPVINFDIAPADRLRLLAANPGRVYTRQKLLERLESKGHVARDRSGHAHLFRARTDREALVGRRLRAMAEQLCGGLMGPLLTHLVKAEALTPRERQELRELIDELDRRKKPRK